MPEHAVAAVEVTVVIPTRDRWDLLAATLRGVLAQRCVTTEVVVVDDGSGSPMPTRAPFDDDRVRSVRHPQSQGVSCARNTGVAAARGRWVAFSDDDDLWAPDKLRDQVDAAEAAAASWAICGAVAFRHRDGRIRQFEDTASPAGTLARLPYWNSVPGGCSGVIARRDALGDAPFDPRLHTLADWDAWLSLAKSGPPATVPAVHVGYRLHDQNMSTRTAQNLAEGELLEAKSAAWRQGEPIDWKAMHYWTAVSALRVGNAVTAQAAFEAMRRRGNWQGGVMARAVRVLGTRWVDPVIALRTWPPRRRVAAVRAWLEPLRAG